MKPHAHATRDADAGPARPDAQAIGSLLALVLRRAPEAAVVAAGLVGPQIGVAAGAGGSGGS